MAQISRQGFGQVEPNHLSGQRTGQLFAQLPAKEDIKILENGQFVKYDYANKEVNFTGEGSWLMVFNEVKLYDEWRETYKDFAMKKENYTKGGQAVHYGVGPFKGQMTPRLIKINKNDHYTTNTIAEGNTSGNASVEGIELVVGDFLEVGEQGYLVKKDDNSGSDMLFQVVEETTMPDGQPAVKIICIRD